MKIYIYGERTIPIINECYRLIYSNDNLEVVPRLDESDVAIAPLLNEYIPEDRIYIPRHGTLIFHPSLLPRHRGSDSIKWAFKLGESYTGATWFWANKGLDTGPICEMEVLAIKDGERPRDFYERAVIPSAIRQLEYILKDLQNGVIRKRPQIEENASYEMPLIKKYVK
ncbi:formyltransferase family protein [Lysinibacillus xylanilyticus]|uniref:formyltransferase family protein n=1 Tax=Lysinibacillus xylanilyticus TaxID=582475 RepID=UPI003814EC9C